MEKNEALARWLVKNIVGRDPDELFNLRTEVGVSPEKVAHWQRYVPEAESIISWMEGHGFQPV
jgi:hypothetical protein